VTPRLPKLPPNDLTDDQRAVYDSIAGGRRAQGPQRFRLTDDDGALEGPFNAFLLQPRVGNAMQALGAAIRYETHLSDRHREIAILVVAATKESAFEWHAHEGQGRDAGLTDEDLAGLKASRFEGLAGADRVIAETAYALANRGDLDDAEYARALDVLGKPGLFEVLTLVGYYSALALQLRVFRV
jgi:4-carboxymuconolactone decarboxylase